MLSSGWFDQASLNMMDSRCGRHALRWSQMRSAVVRRLVVMVLACGFVPVTTADEPAPVRYLDTAARETALVELEGQLANLTSVKVRFRQERDIEIFTSPVVSEGVLAFVRPDRLHWEWIKPYPSVLVLNRGRIERFDVTDGTVKKIRAAGEEMLRSVAIQMTRWMQGRFRESSDLFEIEVCDASPPTIVLATKSSELRKVLMRVEVALDRDARVSTVTLIAPQGDTTVMRFSDEQRNLELDDALFDLHGPLLIGDE